jgi:putative peptidoglycan lipid II flippase
MIRRLFKFTSNSVTSAALLLGGASLLSRLLGLLRVRIFAHRFGAGQELDIYNTAFRIPDLIFMIIIMGAVSSAFIPIFTSSRFTNDKKNQWLLANNFLHIFSFIVLLLAIVLVIVAPYLIKVIAPGFSVEAQATTTIMTRIMLIQPILLAISGIISGILQSFNIFFAFALSPLLYNVGIIAGALFFTKLWGVFGLAWGVVLGAGLHLLIQLPSLPSTGYRYKFYINWKDTLMRKIIKLTIPRSIGLITSQLNTIVTISIASTLTIGSIAIFTYANDIQYVPLGTIGIAFATAAFPLLSAAFAKKDFDGFKITFIRSTLETIYLALPMAIAFFLLRYEVTSVLLQTGKFGLKEVELTASTIALFCFGIPFQTLVPLLSRAFFAIHNTITPVIINVLSTGINIALALWLIRMPQFFSVFKIDGDKRILGLPLAYALASIINVLLLWVFLGRKIGPIEYRKIALAIFKFLVAGFALGISLFLSRNFLYQYLDQSKIAHLLIIGLISGIIGVLVYLLASYLLKIGEIKSIMKVFKR